MSLLTLRIEANQLAHTTQVKKACLNCGFAYEEDAEFSAGNHMFISDLKN
jgi:hypothetical protein